MNKSLNYTKYMRAVCLAKNMLTSGRINDDGYRHRMWILSTRYPTESMTYSMCSFAGQQILAIRAMAVALKVCEFLGFAPEKTNKAV